MARRKATTALDKFFSKIIALVVIFIVIGTAFTAYPIPAITIGVIIIVIMALQVRKCELCGALIKRQSYKWEIKGEKKRVCPKCNNNLENKRSREVIRNL